MWMMPMVMASTNLVIMFVPIRDGKAFEEGEYSRGYYYASIMIMIITIIIYLGGCNWIIAILKKLCFSSSIITRSENSSVAMRTIRKDEQKYPTYK